MVLVRDGALTITGHSHANGTCHAIGMVKISPPPPLLPPPPAPAPIYLATWTPTPQADTIVGVDANDLIFDALLLVNNTNNASGIMVDAVSPY